MLELALFASTDTEHALIAWARRVTTATVRTRADEATRKDLEEVREEHASRSLLVMLCPFHHWLVHEGGWSVSLHDGEPTFFRPSGRSTNPGYPSPTSPWMLPSASHAWPN